MKLEIEVPDKTKLMQTAIPVALALRGEPWSESQLGMEGKTRGVYVIHHQGSVKYVGKTDRPEMYFAKRLRREFTQSGSQGRHIYPRLAELRSPPPILVSLLSLDEIDSLVHAYEFDLARAEKCLILEQALIAAYRPEFQFLGDS